MATSAARAMREGFLRVPIYEAQRPFRFAGKDYKPGDKFDWRKVGCAERKLRLMYGRQLKLPEGKLKRAEPEPLSVVDDEEFPRMVHTGGGWYDVILSEGAEPVRVQGKEAAEAMMTGGPEED